MVKVNRKILIIGGTAIALFLSIIALTYYKPSSQETTLSEEITIDKNYVNEDIKLQEETEKMYNFILSKLPDKDVYLDVTATSEDEDYKIDPKTEVIQALYTALVHNDIDMLVGVFTSEAIAQTFKNENNPDGRINTIKKYVEILTKNNTLKDLSYQLKMNKYGSKTNEGVLIFKYEDNEQIKVPFQFEQIEEVHEGEKSYYIATPLSEIVTAIKNNP